MCRAPARRDSLSELWEHTDYLQTLDCFLKEKKKKIPSLHCIKAREPGEALINPHQPAEGNCTARQTFLFREKPYRKPISSPSDKIRGRERAVELMGQEGAVCKPSLSGTVVIIP